MSKKQAKVDKIVTGLPVEKSGFGEVGTASVFTYVGGGEDSPRVINFMGMQRFVRGEATEVTDPLVLSKIINNPTFVEGEVEQVDLHEHDVEASKEANARRVKDKAIDESIRRRVAKWAKGSED